ncbi:hypothetical protein GF352_02290 [archaeon]|nr:hypothetical protein [archaeon]
MSLRKRIGSAARKLEGFFNWLFRGKSLGSHLAFLVFAYIALKFVLFPAFLWVTGLNDVVAVLSGSMHHQPGSIEGTFDNWLEFNDYNESEYKNWPFIKGLDVGDAVTVLPGNITIGDVVVYYHGNEMIIHRVVMINKSDGLTYYTTKGDANPDSMDFEIMIPESKIVGKAGTRVPLIGWPRTMMYYLVGV